MRERCADVHPAGYQGTHRVTDAAAGTDGAGLIDVPMYQVDAVVRRAPSLQRTARRAHARCDVLTDRAAAVPQTLHTLWTSLPTLWASLPDYVRSTVWIVIVTVVLILCVAFLTLWERKVIGWMQLRRGPNRVRIFGLAAGPRASRSPMSSSC